MIDFWYDTALVKQSPSSRLALSKARAQIAVLDEQRATITPPSKSLNGTITVVRDMLT